MKTHTLSQRMILFCSIAVLGLAADLWTKSTMFSMLGLPHEAQQYVDWWVIDDFFGFQTAVNQGALFGMGQGKVILFRIFSAVALVAIGYWFIRAEGWKSLWLTICLSAISAGILGNLYDRFGLWHPHAGFTDQFPNYAYGVRDFILFTYRGHVWPNFNIADCLLVCGAVMLAIFSFRSDGSARHTKPLTDVPDPSDCN